MSPVNRGKCKGSTETEGRKYLDESQHQCDLGQGVLVALKNCAVLRRDAWSSFPRHQSQFGG